MITELRASGIPAKMPALVTGILLALCLAAPCAPVPAPAAVGDGLIPFERLSPETQARLKAVTEHAMFRRGLAAQKFRSREALFVYLLDHPDVSAAVARAINAGNYRIERQPDGSYLCDDNQGATGTVEVSYTDIHKRVFYGRGDYRSKWLPTIHARIVTVFDFEHERGDDGKSYVRCRITGYLRVDNPILGILVRLARPVLTAAADREISRTVAMAIKVSESAYDDPDGFLNKLRASTDMNTADLSAITGCLGS